MADAELLAAEARRLIAAAARQEPVDAAVLRAFARACLEGDEIGRLALAVLDGGVFAPRRALELAEVVVRRLGAAAPVKRRS